MNIVMQTIGFAVEGCTRNARRRPLPRFAFTPVPLNLKAVDSPVRGPMLIGAGRYRGYGRFLPMNLAHD